MGGGGGGGGGFRLGFEREVGDECGLGLGVSLGRR